MNCKLISHHCVMPEQWIRLLCSVSVIPANEIVIGRIKSIKLLSLCFLERKCPFPLPMNIRGWQTLKHLTSSNYFHSLSNFNTVVGRKWRHFNNRFWWSKWLKTSDGDAQWRTKACKLFWPVAILRGVWVGHDPQIFAWPPSFFLTFPFKFIWLTYTVDNFRPAIF